MQYYTEYEILVSFTFGILAFKYKTLKYCSSYAIKVNFMSTHNSGIGSLQNNIVLKFI